MASVDPKAAGELVLTLPASLMTERVGQVASVMATENLEGCARMVTQPSRRPSAEERFKWGLCRVGAI